MRRMNFSLYLLRILSHISVNFEKTRYVTIVTFQLCNDRKYLLFARALVRVDRLVGSLESVDDNVNVILF